MSVTERTFYITFELEGGRPPHYERVYALVHEAGGFRYCCDEHGAWTRLPATTVALRLAATRPQVARVAFELMLAQADLVASAVLVTGEDVVLTPQRVEALEVPWYARRGAAARVPVALTV